MRCPRASGEQGWRSRMRNMAKLFFSAKRFSVPVEKRDPEHLSWVITILGGTGKNRMWGDARIVEQIVELASSAIHTADEKHYCEQMGSILVMCNDYSDLCLIYKANAVRNLRARQRPE